MSRVLLLSTGIPDPTQGGSGIFDHYVANELVARGHDTDALLRVSPEFLRDHTAGQHLAALEARGLRTTLVPQTEGPSRLHAGGAFLRASHAVATCRAALRALGPLDRYDACLSFDLGWAIALGDAPLRSVRLLADPLPDRLRWQPGQPGGLLARGLRAVRIASIARAYRVAVRDLARTPGTTLGSFSPREAAQLREAGIPVTHFRWFAPGPRTVRRDAGRSDRFVVLHVGDLATTASRRMLAYWGELLPALAALPFPIELRLVGRSRRSAVPEAPANVTIVMTDHVASLEDEFASADAFLSPIPYPVGVRTRIVTALAHGIPVIADVSAAGGLPELRHDEDILFTRTPHEIGGALRRLHDDPGAAVRIGAAGRAAWERHHRPEHNVPLLIDALLDAGSAR